MARPPRPQFPGAIYHVMTRGNRKEAIFTDTRDRLRFLQLLEQIVTSLEWRWPYVLLDAEPIVMQQPPFGP